MHSPQRDKDEIRYTGGEKGEEGHEFVGFAIGKRELRWNFDFKYASNTVALTSGLGHPL